jgi:hypothetical protein
VLAVLDAEIARYEQSAEIDALTGSDNAARDLRRRCQRLRKARAAVKALLKTTKRAMPEIEQAFYVLRNSDCAVTAQNLERHIGPLKAALSNIEGGKA